jgi:hypothetical protein
MLLSLHCKKIKSLILIKLWAGRAGEGGGGGSRGVGGEMVQTLLAHMNKWKNKWIKKNPYANVKKKEFCQLKTIQSCRSPWTFLLVRLIV